METDAPRAPAIRRGITAPKLKRAAFGLEALNGLATTYIFYDLYFYTQQQFHFGQMQNLLLAALLGAVCAIGSFWSGRFAQRFGYLTSIRLGAVVMALAIFACSLARSSVWLTLVLTVIAATGMAFTWPAMEALITEGEPAARLPGLIGVYNCIWAALAGTAYFTCGALTQNLGWNSVFYISTALFIGEFVLASWLEAQTNRQTPFEPGIAQPFLHPISEGYRSPVPPSAFLKMAWLANPMAYLAINTIISSMPSVAGRLGLSPMFAGFVCSIWLFARAAAFVGLWLWPGWHYRFRFLAVAYILMMLSFGAMLLIPSILGLILAQLLLGPAVGLIYYSSLFYSMDVGTTKGEHGGIHEAAIGVGNTVGPAVAASALRFVPGRPGVGAWAVCLLLTPGLIALFWTRYKDRTAPGRYRSRRRSL